MNEGWTLDKTDGAVDSSRFILTNSLHALSQVHAFSSRWAGKILILHCGYTPVLWHIKDIHSALEDTGSQWSNTQIHTSIHILTVAGTHWLCDLLATFIRFTKTQVVVEIFLKADCFIKQNLLSTSFKVAERESIMVYWMTIMDQDSQFTSNNWRAF